MKKLLFVALVVCAIFALCSAAYADIDITDTLSKIPSLKQGIAYSITESDFSYLSTFEIANYKGFALEAGYSQKNKLVGVISYELVNAKKLGITLPVLDLIDCRVGLWAGYSGIKLDNDNAAFEWGPSVTLINVKF